MTKKRAQRAQFSEVVEAREVFNVEASFAETSGEFEILAMTAGVGNGWNFGESALQESLALWDGVNMFVDHGSLLSSGRSVRDLGGVGHSPAWDPDAKGVRLSMKCTGPSGPLMEALGREMVKESTSPRMRVGLSADVAFTANGRDVKQILRVFSLDVVFDPARGGAFLRAINQAQNIAPLQSNGATSAEGSTMSEVNGLNTFSPNTNPAPAAPVNQDLEAMRTLLTVQKEKDALAAEAEQARILRVQMCGYLLESGIAASKLPAPAAERVRKQFAGKVFEPQELTTAIEDARALVSELTGGASVAGVGRVREMYDSRDQLQAAVDDLFEVARDDAVKSAHIARLSGIRELYHMLTGDFDFHGGVYPERARFQATTATFTGLVKNAMNKALIEHWNRLGAAGYDWWNDIVHVEHFDTLNQITWMIFGTVGALPTVAEGAEYTELKIGDSPETTDFSKYGGYVGITLEALDRDNTRKLKAIPRELAASAIRKVSSLVAAVFTDNAGIGPTLADTGALFNATAVATKGGHLNLLAVALSAAQWDVVSAAVYNQPMLVANEATYYGTGSKMAINPRYLLVPRTLELTAKKILYPGWENAANIHSENMQKGAMGDVKVVPEWTSTTNWAAVVDPALVPGICIGERFGLKPEIFVAGDELSPAVFMNDESRIKVRHYIAVGVADFRPLHKENI